MKGEGRGGVNGGNKRRRIHGLGKHWRKYHRKPGVGDGVRGTCSRGRGGTAGAGEQGFRDSGKEMGDAQLGRQTRAADGDAGTETGNVQVGGGTRASLMAG